jgi:hypothetical protein
MGGDGPTNPFTLGHQSMDPRFRGDDKQGNRPGHAAGHAIFYVFVPLCEPKSTEIPTTT